MNSYALLEDVLAKARQRTDDPWQAGNLTEDICDVASECGWTVSDLYPEISRRNSRRSSTFSLHSYNSAETLLNIAELPITYHGSLGVYLAACRRYNEVPLAVVQETLMLRELHLSYQNMNDISIKSLALALTVNDTVVHLDVSNNRITVEGLDHIKHLMLNNQYIKYLNVSHNQIGSKGLKHLSGIIKNNITLKSLLIAGNRFGPGYKFTAQFAMAIQNCVTLHELDVGYNQFGEESGPAWAAAIAGNFGLKKLILRWNHLRWRGAMVLLEALSLNDTLTVLDIAWNGIADEGVAMLARVLMTNTTLTDLDLTCNRISFEGAVTLCEGLRYNSTLLVLKMNNNPITTIGASTLLLMFQTYSQSGLKRLELLDIEVDREFETILSEIQSSSRSLEVIHGGRVIQGDVYMSSSKKQRTRLGDPLMVLFEHVKNSNLRLWDLFAQLDKDKSLSISRDEFRNGMKEANVPLDEHQIERIMDSLDKDKNGEITFEELLEGHKRYREKERKKYETLLPFILNRPSSARQNSDILKDMNAPTPRVKANTIMSMSGYMGETLPEYNAEPRLSLPTIKVTSDHDSSNTTETHHPSKFSMTNNLGYSESSAFNSFKIGSTLSQYNQPSLDELPLIEENNDLSGISDNAWLLTIETLEENPKHSTSYDTDHESILADEKISRRYVYRNQPNSEKLLYRDQLNTGKQTLSVEQRMPLVNENRRASMPAVINSTNLNAPYGLLNPENI